MSYSWVLLHDTIIYIIDLCHIYTYFFIVTKKDSIYIMLLIVNFLSMQLNEKLLTLISFIAYQFLYHTEKKMILVMFFKGIAMKLYNFIACSLYYHNFLCIQLALEDHKEKSFSKEVTKRKKDEKYYRCTLLIH